MPRPAGASGLRRLCKMRFGSTTQSAPAIPPVTRPPRHAISAWRGCRRRAAGAVAALRGAREKRALSSVTGRQDGSLRTVRGWCGLARALHPAPLVRLFSCPKCDRVLFFENTVCTNCGQYVGYSVEARALVAVPSDPEKARQPFLAPAPGARSTRYLKCKNFAELDTCNWLVRASEDQPYCRSCRLTEVVPDLADAKNRSALME